MCADRRSDRLSGFRRAILAAACVVSLSAFDAQEPPSTRTPAGVPAQFVIIVSVDGLRPDAITSLPADELPHFYRFRREGAFTDNARTDHDVTLSLPNHATMMTGRPVHGPDGHRLASSNLNEPTIHEHAGIYVSSIFDVVHDAGLRTALYVGKPKFDVFWRTYADKIDVFYYHPSTEALVDQFVSWTTADPAQLSFLHFHELDTEAHTNGWSLDPESRYMRSIRQIDEQLGVLFHLVEHASPFAGKTAIILTAGHGGRADVAEHSDPEHRDNYTVPFYVWGPGVEAGTELLALNPNTRADSGTMRRDYATEPPPIRNGDAGNLAMTLLALPSIPGSAINVDFPLLINVPDNIPPTARIETSGSAGWVPMTVDFDGSSSDDEDGRIVRYRWDFGDGATATGLSASHTYRETGNFDATLTVLDDKGGLGTTSVTITVEEPPPPPPSFEPVKYVIAISVDGMRPDAVTSRSPEELPNFYRFRFEGAITDNARTDHVSTHTLPNHASMITGRPVYGVHGHLLSRNGDGEPPLHELAGTYVAGMFDVAHNAGLQTGLYAAKSKFDVYQRTYPDKIDVFFVTSSHPGILRARFIDEMSADPMHLTLVHFHNPDSDGHATGWELGPDSKYIDAIRMVDTQIGRIFQFVEETDEFRGRTAIILTSDHGGREGTRGHSEHDHADNYTIPFYVWGPGVPAGADLYALNPNTRLDPGTDRVDYDHFPPPIRNGDLGNLALRLLGLPPIPGSVINTAYPLQVTESTYLPPKAQISTSLLRGHAPLTVHFDGSASIKRHGPIAAHTWDFGDGTTAAGVSASHTYVVPGHYHATLEVTDVNGVAGFAGVSVVVADPSEPLSIAFQDGALPTSTYEGTRDTKIRDGHPQTNFGADTDLEVDGRPNDAALVKWDVSTIPPGARVVAASLELWIFNPSEDTFYVYEVLRSWEEHEATWLTASNAAPWEVAGVRGTSDRGREVLGNVVRARNGRLTMELNEEGIAAVQRWIAEPASNYGIIFKHYDDAPDAFRFYSREHPDPAFRPRLNVTYVLTGSAGEGTGSGVITNTDREPDHLQIEKLRIVEAYPNPFNPRTTLVLEVVASGSHSIEVFDLLGRRVLATEATLSAGRHDIPVDLSHAGTGTYFVVASDPNHNRSQARRILLIK